MKKHFLFTAAVAALLTCACSVEPVDVLDVQPEEDGEITVLTAGFASDEDGTRTVRQPDGKVFWSPADEIAVLGGRRMAKFTSTNTEPQATATFEGKMTSGIGSTDEFWAIHPYSACGGISGDYVVTVLPDQQETVAGTFSDDQFISVAYFTSESETLSFYHVVGGLKFTVSQPGIKKVSLIAQGGEPLAGVMGIQNYNGRPTFMAWGDTQSRIDLTPASGTFEVGEAYHFVTIPMTLQKGFTLLFEKEDGAIAYRSLNKPVTFEAAHFKTMAEVDRGLVFEKDYFTFSPSEISMSRYGGTLTVKVHASVDFHFDVASDWIWEVNHEGNPLMEATYTFKVSPNTGEAREGYVLICDDTNCYFITVNQEAGSEDDWKTADFVHHSLGMRFTATWCGYCPIMNETFKLAKGKLGDRFQYACFYSSSNGGNYGFSGTSTLANQYLVSGFPTGILDGRFEIKNYSSTEYGSEVIVQGVEETEANYPTATGIGLKASRSGQKVTVDVDIYTKLADNYKLTVLLLENNIIGYQADYNEGDHEDFVHNKVVREAFTSVSGDPFTAGAQEKKSFSFSTTLSDEYDPDNLEVLVYVQRPFGSQTVIQSGAYGDYYVDNCYTLPVGRVTAPDLK